MPQGIPRSNLTADHREFYDQRRLENALIMLFQIRNDLNPESFTRAEYLEEFDTNLDKGESGMTGHTLEFDVDMPLLIEAGYVEKEGKTYRLTQAGMDVEEM